VDAIAFEILEQQFCHPELLCSERAVGSVTSTITHERVASAQCLVQRDVSVQLMNQGRDAQHTVVRSISVDSTMVDVAAQFRGVDYGANFVRYSIHCAQNWKSVLAAGVGIKYSSAQRIHALAHA